MFHLNFSSYALKCGKGSSPFHLKWRGLHLVYLGGIIVQKKVVKKEMDKYAPLNTLNGSYPFQVKWRGSKILKMYGAELSLLQAEIYEKRKENPI
jgi:hypothetical protein